MVCPALIVGFGKQGGAVTKMSVVNEGTG